MEFRESVNLGHLGQVHNALDLKPPNQIIRAVGPLRNELLEVRSSVRGCSAPRRSYRDIGCTNVSVGRTGR
jgi:hypothetical protein